jgi:hypothetical protein
VKVSLGRNSRIIFLFQPNNDHTVCIKWQTQTISVYYPPPHSLSSQKIRQLSRTKFTRSHPKTWFVTSLSEKFADNAVPGLYSRAQ